MPSDTIDYREKLIQNGIKRNLIPPALTNDQCQVLFNKLKFFRISWIEETWQLLAILGDEATYKNVDRKDSYDLNMAHYAVLSGDLQRLNQVLAQRPTLFYQFDAERRGAAHYAALSGNLVVLQWIKDNKPALLNTIDKAGWTIAHYAAHSGNPKVLRWIKKNHLEALLMDKNARDTFLIAAAHSGNGEQLNLALALCGNPSEINFSRLTAENSTALSTLREALQSNYTLTSVVYPYFSELWDEVETLLEKNEVIILRLNKLSDDFTVLCQQDKTGARTCPLSKDALLALFTTAAQAISPRIPEKDIKAQFYKIYNNSIPLKHDAALAAKGKILDFKIKSETLTGFRACFINKKVAQLKRHAMSDLKALILKADTFTENDLRQWYLEHQESVNRQTNTLTGFFFKTRETASRALVRNICKDFGFDEQRITANPENEHSGEEAIAVLR
ncbi:ankyrin repeat-containing protein [Legionella rubrilucens]|uniref:Ankyrin repeat-containing protein n=1 Tax=Legionella rubrilucens TaxID=458 RepID=A0A0W0Y016_9GAMM|nr:ankyrin repeat domain-containing protein [Legionella rubrilucens]KTD49924.1 ankyrin repeat-containing protein [Legionella rubrilucens]